MDRPLELLKTFDNIISNSKPIILILLPILYFYLLNFLKININTQSFLHHHGNSVLIYLTITKSNYLNSFILPIRAFIKKSGENRNIILSIIPHK